MILVDPSLLFIWNGGSERNERETFAVSNLGDVNHTGRSGFVNERNVVKIFVIERFACSCCRCRRRLIRCGLLPVCYGLGKDEFLFVRIIHRFSYVIVQWCFRRFTERCFGHWLRQQMIFFAFAFRFTSSKNSHQKQVARVRISSLFFSFSY